MRVVITAGKSKSGICFDAWRWNEYWVPLEVVIEFKRDVYQMALTELARYLPRGMHHNRYLRSGMRPHHRDEEPPASAANSAQAAGSTLPESDVSVK